ncbi:ribonuclease H-like domain-containing protein [Candidatus Micrarchaeota archaeon]|nr:ribonuclease H-like domain-containing protein [Candidatus Micrarchaeota archaeon]
MKNKDRNGTLKAFLLDAEHVLVQGESAIRLMLKLESGTTIRMYDSFEPYFLVQPQAPDEKSLQECKKSLEGMRAFGKAGEVKTKRVEETTLSFRNKKMPFLKVFAFLASDVPLLRHAAEKHGVPFEFDIPYTRRYLLDKRLRPNALHEIEHEGLRVKSIKALDSQGETPKFRMLSLDIETYNPDAMPNAEKDPVLMIGYDGEAKGVYSYKKKFSNDFTKTFASEKEMLEGFCALLREKKIDLLCTYNGDQFDLPYLQKRAKRIGADLRLGRDKGEVKTKRLGLREVSKVSGRIHYDVFPVASFLNFIGTIKVERLTLEEVYFTVLGGKKLGVKKQDIHKIWDTGSQKELDFLAEYCLTDAIACIDLTKNFLHLHLELGKLVQMPLVEVSRATASQLVETYLLSKAFVRGELAPNKPSSADIYSRQSPVEGAFVKTPDAGLYENIAVLDFRSLYPSIIISHNIDVTTFDCDCCTKAEAFISPQGHKFCKKRKGIIPEMLEEILAERAKIKKEMKKFDSSSSEYKALDARQWGLKILANSTYGYLLYARSRWYSREGGEATTAWGRHYVQDVLKKAEEFGLKPLYSDTDSTFLLYESKEKVLEFQKQINASLPEAMQLELEGFYPRGIFVSKKAKGEEKGAKKKYALIGEDGKIKIRGFELVRRDWSKIARETQRKVLEIMLREGSVEKAVTLVKKVVEDLKEGRVPIEECVIYTQLRKSASSYEIQSPELGAVQHARKQGVRVPENAIIGFVITKEGKESSKSKQKVYLQSRLIELAKDYDPDYYVNHQVLPAVLRILGSLGFDEDSLKNKGKQTGLESW